MKETQAIVQRVRAMNADYQQIELASDEALDEMKAGQALLARPRQMRLTEQWEPYLREVWHPTYVSNRRITTELSARLRLEPGDVIDLIGPIGQPFKFRTSLRNVLLLAVNTSPIPLMMTVPQLLGNQVSVTLVLLGSAIAYPTTFLPPEVEIVHGDDPKTPLSWPNQVVSIGWADQVFAVVPRGDEVSAFRELWHRFSERRSEISKNYLFGVFQGLLPCGVGACEACMIATREGNKLPCTEGPAFDLHTLFG